MELSGLDQVVSFVLLPGTMAFIGFASATVGLGNSSRQRWEDASIQKAALFLSNPDAGSSRSTGDFKNSVELLDRATKQACRDFHHWYGTFFFATSCLEIALAILFASAFICRPCPDDAGILVIRIVSLIGCGFASVIPHRFIHSRYVTEATEVLKDSRTFRAFLPWIFHSDGMPK